MRRYLTLALALLLAVSALGQSNVSIKQAQFGSGGIFSCGLAGLAATLTQCQAAPGTNLSLYITDVVVGTTTTTSGTFAIRSGTGTNCATATAGVFPVASATATFQAPISSSPMAGFHFQTPLKVASNSAVCVIGTATNTINIQIVGFASA